MKNVSWLTYANKNGGGGYPYCWTRSYPYRGEGVSLFLLTHTSLYRGVGEGYFFTRPARYLYRGEGGTPFFLAQSPPI